MRDADGKAYTQDAVKETLDRLKRLRLVIVSYEGFTCAPAMMHHVTFASAAEGHFADLARVIQTEIPSTWGSNYYRSSKLALRDLRIAFYRRDADYAFQLLDAFTKQFSLSPLQPHPFVQICTDPFDAAWFRTLPVPLATTTLKELFSGTAVRLVQAQEPFAALTDLVEQGSVSAEEKGIYALELLLRDRLDEAEQLAHGLPHSSGRSVLALVALRQGRYQEAAALFEDALVLIKKETGKRRTFFTNLAGPCFILALIATGDPALAAKARQHCDFVQGRREWPLEDLIQLLAMTIQDISGEGTARNIIEILCTHKNTTLPLAPLFQAMALYWSGSPRAREKGEELIGLARQAREAGYLYLAGEMEIAAATCGASPPSGTKLRATYKKSGLVPLIDVVKRAEIWEKALSALIKLNEPEQKEGAKPASESRLIWYFEDHGRFIELQPREQKQTATGKWTAGRNVALKRLALETKDIDFLSDQDRLVCQAIKPEHELGYGYYGRDVYRLDLEQALLLLVGHPDVYLDPAAQVRLELFSGEPELQLAAQGDTLTMSLFPQFEKDKKIALVRESQNRIRVYEAKDEYRKISGILGEGLRIPAAAKEKALEAVRALSSLVVVHSDVGGAGDTVPGDTTPCFHLLPYQHGVKVELLVRPFADAGPYFAPGSGGETVLAELDGKKLQARRDLKLEVRQALRVLSELTVLEGLEDEDHRWLVPDPEKALELLEQFQELGDQVRVAWPEGARFKVAHQASMGHCRMTLRHTRDWFEIEGEVRVNDGLTLNLQELLRLMQEGMGRFIPLGEGEFLALSNQLRKRLDDLAAYAEPHGKGLRFHPLASRVFSEFFDEVGEMQVDESWRSQVRRLREAEEFVPAVPSTLRAELRGYQEEGFAWLNRLARWGVGACLADDMGLGKTVQALAQILTMAEHGPSLVVAPTSVCTNWESEAARFAPTLNVIPFGPGNRKECLEQLKPFDLVICSYGLLQQEAELLALVQWQGIVLDEAQAIKNTATKRSQAAMELKGAFKMVATGTPIENHLGELWNIFRFINPGLLGSLKQFNVKYASPIEKTQDKKARARLKKLIQPFILRRTKSQVLEELPSRTEIVLKVEMSEAEASLYEALRRNAMVNLSGLNSVDGKEQNHIKILAEIMRLRRACCNPRLVMPESTISSCKLTAFGEIMDELRENRHKALVFSQFVDHLQIVREYVERAGISYQYLDGSTPSAERKRRVDAFQAGEGELFLISLKAGGVGLNLTAADYVIHLDPWWNPAVEDQASDRAHRIGQQRPVTIYRLVTKGTVEEKIVDLHQQKRGLAESLLEETDLSAKVTAEELLALLSPPPPKW
ncbi:DEAD/DEAH box helicase [Geomonas sp. Red875]|uniref:DEAD/DEAH box helicase n=2 Tax=Geomesophilobacter sediminis TaxID=2798584 RepID=A0A8J7LXP6_9BACT|nr:DEAD/DEAH box helicase [Geomesophilobacter sediminis]